MSQSYSFLYCHQCRAKTVHCKPSAQSPHFCMRHDSQVLGSYNDRKEGIAELIREAKGGVLPFPSWTAYKERN